MPKKDSTYRTQDETIAAFPRWGTGEVLLLDETQVIVVAGVEYYRLENKVPVGWWRSVGENMNLFPLESAIDEAAAAGAEVFGDLSVLTGLLSSLVI